MKQYLRPLSIALLALFLAVQSSFAEVGNDNPTGVTGEHNGSVTTAGSYDPYTGNAKRFIDDLSVTGAVGTYPLKWTRVLNSRGHGGPFGHGGGWSHSYAWGLWVRDMNQPYHYYPNPYEGPAGGITYPDGRQVALESYDPHIYTPIASSAEPMDRLVYVEGSNGEYNLLLRDGGRVEFRHAADTTGEYAFLYATTIVDPYGLKTTLERDSQGRLWQIKEPAGRFLQINYQRLYGMTSDSYIDVVSSVDVYADANTKVETVAYSYDSEVVISDGFYVKYWYLKHVSYDDATQAEYTYYPAGQATQEYRVKLPGCVESCRDVRFAGPMKNIRYEYLKRDQNYPEAAWGQITAEENLTTGQPVKISEIEYPVYNPHQTWDPGWRIEHRPDGATRRFDYYGGELWSYTDFTYPGEPAHTSTIQYVYLPDGVTYEKTLTDARGKATRITKDGITGAVLSVKHPGDGSTIDYTYSDPDNAYYLTSKTDERRNTTVYTRGYRNRVDRIDYPDTGFEAFIYDEGHSDGFNQVTDHLMTSGGTEHFRYDGRGRKTLYWPPPTCDSIACSDPNPQDHPTQYFYYESGPNTDRLRQVIDPRQKSTSYEYNARGQVTKVIHDQDGTYTENGYNPLPDGTRTGPDGTLAWTEDELRHRTAYEYDEYARVTSVTKPYAASAATNDYSPWNGRGKFSHTTASVYRATSATGKITDSDYDANFRRKSMTQAPDTNDAATTTYTYDEVGNLQTVTEPNHQQDGKFTLYEYDDRNRQFRVTDVFGKRTETAYDVANNKTSVTPADGHPIQFVDYDPMNRLKEQIDEWQKHSYFEYFPGGNLKSHKDENGNVYSDTYDELNRKKTATYPPDSGNAIRTEHWTYDEAGNLKTFTNRSGAVQTFTLYDSRNRLIDFAWSDGTSWQHTEYDPASRVTWIVNNVSTIHQTYDDPNHRSTEEEWTSLFNDNNTHRAVTYTYDDDGNRLSLTYPSGASFNYEYTTKNQLKAIWPAGQGQPAVGYSYDPTGNVTGISRDNGTSTSLTPDDANRVTSITHNFVGTSPRTFDYAYNDVNNLRAVRRDGNLGDWFDYNDRREITAFKRDGAFPVWPPAVQNPQVNSPTNSMSIAFDPAGNRVSLTSSNPAFVSASYQVNYLNQYTGITESGGPSPTATPPPGSTPTPTATPPATPTATATATATPTATIPPLSPTPTPTATATATPPQQVAEPICNPEDQYIYFTTGFKTISVSTATAGANMRYTINGSPPTSTTGTLIASQSGTVQLTPSSQGTTLRIIAFKAGMSDSPVHSATYYYEADPPAQADQGSNGQPGYDANGNLTSYKGWIYTYDAQNRLTGASNGATSAEFYYDGKNRQIARRIGGVVRFSSWDNWELLEEYAGGMQRTEGYLQGATGVIKTLVTNRYYYQDKLGSTTHIANASGTLLEAYRYDLYGTPSYFNSTSQPINSSTVGVTDLYGGERWISELGLYDLRNRFMSPELGRFLQPDPIGFKGDASNLYRYCGNDSIDKSDPMGLENPAAQAVGGSFWAMEKFFDSSNTSQLDYNQTFNPIRPQAGMNDMGAGGGAPGGGKSVSKENEGKKADSQNRFIPTIVDKDDKTKVLPTSTDHSGGTYEYQYSTSTGRRLSGVGRTVLEKLTTTGGEDVKNYQKVEKPLHSNGVFPDWVGSHRRPSSVDNGRVSRSEQRFEVRNSDGTREKVSTVLGHEVRFENGAVIPRVWIITP